MPLTQFIGACGPIYLDVQEVAALSESKILQGNGPYRVVTMKSGVLFVIKDIPDNTTKLL